MEKQIITFSANEQILKKTAGKDRFADDVVGYIEAHFDLGDNWTGYDSVRAVWFTAFAQISTVLDQNGVCLVPPEVCNRKEAVNVNLVGSIIENNELTDRLTTYPIEAFIFDGNARVDGSETVPVTPSQFEQYVAIVEALVGSVKDIDHAALNADYTLTIYYSDGTQDTVGPIRGEQGPTGPTGNGIASIAKTGTSGTNPVVDTYTITYTNGQTTTFTVTNGVKGDTGNGIQSIYKTGTSGAVDTYTILYTDGNTTEFTVTNGEVTNAVLTAAIQQAKEDLVDQFAVKDTASGVIASFPDGADWPAKNVLADINPVQDLNGYSKPWPAGGNVNLLDPTKKTTYDGSNGLRWYQADGFTLKANQAYTLKFFSQGESVALYIIDKVTTTSLATGTGAVTYTPTEDKTVYFQAYRTPLPQDDNRYILVKGSTAPDAWTPYSNICPISGRTECVTEVCGVNVWDEEWEVGGIDYATGQTSTFSTRTRSKNYIPVLEGKTYYIKLGSGTISDAGLVVCYYDENKNYISGAWRGNTFNPFTIPSGARYMKFCTGDGYGGTYNHDISINYPSTDHDYHAYNGNTYTTDLGRTVYGGTLDVVSGVLTVTKVSLTFDNTAWTYSSAGFFYRNVLNAGDNVSNYYMTENGVKMYLNGNNGQARIYLNDNPSLTSDSDIGALLNGYKLVYELATPITYQLTPTEVELLLGANNVWADTGDIEVTYVADTKLYIDKMTA